jgi:endonuclease/exonuclease/phosphatase family metal-dependent hydrolase
MANGARLRAATYNIHRAVGRDRRKDPARTLSVLLEIEADVLGLQEVEWQHDDASGESQFEFLTHLPRFTAIPGPNIRDHRGHYGNVLLSRYPVHDVRRIDLGEAGREPRAAIDADLDVDGCPLRVIVTHLGLRIAERRRQAAKLRDTIVNGPTRPTLLLGDLNDWLPASPTLRPLLSVCANTPSPRTYPAHAPLLSLDRILVYGEAAAPDVRRHGTALARAASDHLPVKALVTI